MFQVVAVRGDSELLTDVPVADLEKLLADPSASVWVDLSGALDGDAERIVRDIFRFHSLAIEDCFQSREQPKIEGYEGYLYLITHGLTIGSTPEETEVVELDVFLGKRFLVTHHQLPSRSVKAVQDAAKRGPELMRRGPVALLHAILERQSDNMEPVMDSFDDRISALEEEMLAKPTEGALVTMLALRRNILHLRRWMSKQRDVVLRLSRNEFGLASASETLLFRDVYDRLSRFTDHLEHYRELTISLQDAYLSLTNNRLNEIMKFLTLFTVVLMPLTVITGIYGMNFQYMPELSWKWGYPGVFGVMAVTVGLVLFYFRRQGWLGKNKTR